MAAPSDPSDPSAGRDPRRDPADGRDPRRDPADGRDPRRDVPRTDALLADPRVEAMTGRLGSDVVKQAVHEVQQRLRAGEIEAGAVIEEVLAALPRGASSLRPVLNATGVILHTNLGRAPLSPAAVAAMVEAAGYVDVEYDTATGTRSRRGRATLDALLRRAPAAEAALVVNNGAAALVLAATALARDREVIVSRGEMIEIGDGFRLPELLASTGARLREVGTTNRTSVGDYAAAVGPDTGFILKVHPSNFTVRGFTSSVPVADLAGLGVAVVADIGSGLLEPDPLLPDEPDASSWLQAGATLVTASGDKLLGGPQAGLVLGAADVVERLRRHPLARALRVDKLTLAALEATLTGPPTPTFLSLHGAADGLRARTETLARDLAAAGVPAHVGPAAGVVGGGSAPELELPGWAVRLPVAFAAELRHGVPCVVARVEHGACLVDLRCVPFGDDTDVRGAVLAAAARVAAAAGVASGAHAESGQRPACM
jgi:L-seryl-tRNA(Ser) seleniumtransferase